MIYFARDLDNYRKSLDFEKNSSPLYRTGNSLLVPNFVSSTFFGSFWYIFRKSNNLWVTVSRVIFSFDRFADNSNHCVKCVRIQSYSGPHFPSIYPHSNWIRRDTPNANQSNSEYGHFLRSECWKNTVK